MTNKSDQKGKLAKRRHASRLSAIQALYQMEVTAQGWKAIVKQFQDHRFGFEGESDDYIEADEVYFAEIIEGVVKSQDKIDEAISARLDKKWRLDRLDITLRALMRCAGFEVLMRPDTPARVIIDEYVELAQDFFDGGEPKFVNAALDKLSRDVRKYEFEDG